jgi:hypothetical protein
MPLAPGTGADQDIDRYVDAPRIVYNYAVTFGPVASFQMYFGRMPYFLIL